MGTDRTEGGRRRRRCGQCSEWMDPRAKVCPHCRSRTRQGFREQSRRDLLRLLVVLTLALTSALWIRPFLNLCGWAGGKVGGHLVNGIVQDQVARHAQPVKAAKPH
jgi:hypothetical protein